jgi:hypothetical protein
MKFPSIRDVARELRLINANVEGECDVRLQVWDDGKCVIRYGDSQFDQDHQGYWGSSNIPGCGGKNCQPRRFNSIAVAKELLEQVRE